MGATYSIVVSDEGGSPGGSNNTFSVQLQNNDLCENAFGPLLLNGQSIAGTLDDATVDAVPECEESSPGQAGVWFEVDWLR